MTCTTSSESCALAAQYCLLLPFFLFFYFYTTYLTAMQHSAQLLEEEVPAHPELLDQARASMTESQAQSGLEEEEQGSQ